MLQTGINMKSQSNAPFVVITLDYCAFFYLDPCCATLSGIICNTGLRCLSFLHLSHMSLQMFFVHFVLHCIPLKIFRVFLKCHEEFSLASILQSFRDTRSLVGSCVRVFSTVRAVSYTGMENIQAINASMPVQCQAVHEVERRTHSKSHYCEKWHSGAVGWRDM